MKCFLRLCFLIYFFLLEVYSVEFNWEVNSEIGIEIKEFHKKEAYLNQKNTYSSFIKSEIFFDFNHLKMLVIFILERSIFKDKSSGVDLNKFSTKPPPVIWAAALIKFLSVSFKISLQ